APSLISAVFDCSACSGNSGNPEGLLNNATPTTPLLLRSPVTFTVSSEAPGADCAALMMGIAAAMMNANAASKSSLFTVGRCSLGWVITASPSNTDKDVNSVQEDAKKFGAVCLLGVGAHTTDQDVYGSLDQAVALYKRKCRQSDEHRGHPVNARPKRLACLFQAALDFALFNAVAHRDTHVVKGQLSGLCFAFSRGLQRRPKNKGDNVIFRVREAKANVSFHSFLQCLKRTAWRRLHFRELVVVQPEKGLF